MLDVVQVLVPIDRAVPCGLILHELISNALKHGLSSAHPGRLAVIISRDPPGSCRLSVIDDGAGLPEGELHASLGLRLIRSLVRQIDGSFELERATPGTAAHLSFPIEPPSL